MTILRRATAADLPAIVALQQAAYAENRRLMGVEPMPLQVAYADILARMEGWVAGEALTPDGVLILDPRPDDLLVWSVATHPRARSCGLGNDLLAFAETRARDTARTVLRLYTHEKLTRNIAWYARHGYVVERIEQMHDRRAVHMKKIIQEGT